MLKLKLKFYDRLFIPFSFLLLEACFTTTGETSIALCIRKMVADSRRIGQIDGDGDN